MRETLATPLGPVRIDAAGRLVREVHLGAQSPPGSARSPLGRDLVRYFSGRRVDFGRYEVDLDGFSSFETEVYAATRRIAAGEVETYGLIARAIGRPGGARAVGNALAKNPACIVIPCHRVVAANGLGGFTGGLRWKRALLRLEGTIL